MWLMVWFNFVMAEKLIEQYVAMFFFYLIDIPLATTNVKLTLERSIQTKLIAYTDFFKLNQLFMQ